MNTIKFLLRKEFTLIFRDKTMLPVIFIMPIIQLIVLVFAATFDIKNIDIYVVDKDLSTTSRNMISKFEGSPFFHIKGNSFSLEEAESALKAGETDLILHIPAQFEQKLVRENKAEVQLLIDAINGVVAGIANGYVNSIIMEYNQKVMADWQQMPSGGVPKSINIDYSYWYNPHLNYKTYMVPGILVILVTIIGMFLAGLNLVREKEMGTIEQINVTPIRKHQFIISKLLPFWIIALFELSFGLLVGKLLFDIPMLGNLFLLFGVAATYLLVVLAIGLFFSTLANNQQQIMFISFFFLLVFLLMSGIFTATESMPDWAQQLNRINPLAYFMRCIRMILLKGSTAADVAKEWITMGGFALIMLSLATWRYRKTV